MNWYTSLTLEGAEVGFRPSGVITWPTYSTSFQFKWHWSRWPELQTSSCSLSVTVQRCSKWSSRVWENTSTSSKCTDTRSSPSAEFSPIIVLHQPLKMAGALRSQKGITLNSLDGNKSSLLLRSWIHLEWFLCSQGTCNSSRRPHGMSATIVGQSQTRTEWSLRACGGIPVLLEHYSKGWVKCSESTPCHPIWPCHTPPRGSTSAGLAPVDELRVEAGVQAEAWRRVIFKSQMNDISSLCGSVCHSVSVRSHKVHCLDWLADRNGVRLYLIFMFHTDKKMEVLYRVSSKCSSNIFVLGTIEELVYKSSIHSIYQWWCNMPVFTVRLLLSFIMSYLAAFWNTLLPCKPCIYIRIWTNYSFNVCNRLIPYTGMRQESSSGPSWWKSVNHPCINMYSIKKHV